MRNQPHTILFADDEPNFTDALRAKLEALGFTCVITRDMTETLRFLSTGTHVSVLVTDIMMPSGSDFPDIDSSEAGFHLVRKVRHLCRLGAIMTTSLELPSA